MKRCPQCGREYDTSMMFCLDDGAELLYGPASGSVPIDEPQTAILSGADGLTRQQVQTTDQTVVLPGGTEAEPQSSVRGSTERHSLSAHRAAKPQGSRTAQPQESRAAKLLAVSAIVVLFLLGGFFGYRYLKPV